MAGRIGQRKTAIATAALGATLLCLALALVFPRLRTADAQEPRGGPTVVAQAPQPAAPVAQPVRRGPPIEPSRPNPFLPVAGERQYNIRSFAGPRYPALPMTMTQIGFPPLMRPVGGLAVAAAPAEPERYMRCSAIIWDKGGNVVAVVQVEEAGELQGYTVHPGDLVGSYVVEQITKDTVTLRDRETDKRRRVRLESARTAPAAGAAPAGTQPARPARPPAGRAPRGLPAPPPTR